MSVQPKDQIRHDPRDRSLSTHMSVYDDQQTVFLQPVITQLQQGPFPQDSVPFF